jgi:hypothetical protein
VAIRPDDYTTATVTGELVYMDHDDVALRRQDATLGAMHVYLPRVGYTMKPL